jgi:hypothetical protein
MTAALPEPPRLLTAGVRRRCWTEPRVRAWWIAAAVLGMIALAFAVSGWAAWRTDTRLAERGITVDASIYAVDFISRPGASFDPSNPARLQFPWRGRPYTTHSARKLDGYDRFIVIGDPVQVRVDPDDPENWGTLVEPMPLARRLLAALLTLPAAGGTLLAAIWRRSRLARLWRVGTATPALVLNSAPTALAPHSRAVRCTPAGEADRRVFTVYAPAADAEELVILVRPAPSSLAAAVDWLVRSSG